MANRTYTYDQKARTNVVNTAWNDYAARGSNFYKNIQADLYGKVLHEQCVQDSIIENNTRPHIYAIAYDDVYDYSSVMTASAVNNTTQLERVVIDIYEKDNMYGSGGVYP